MNKKPTFEPAPPAVSSSEPALPANTFHPSADRVAIVRRKEVEARMGPRRSTIYNRIKTGLMTRPVGLGGRIVGWPEAEIVALNRARIAGWSDDQIRKLVTDLEASRANLMTR